MSSTMPMARLEGPPSPYDPAGAKQLLGESGWPDGFNVSIYALAGNADEVATDSAVQQMWNQLRVKLDLGQVDNATRTEHYRAGDFQMRNWAWNNDINNPARSRRAWRIPTHRFGALRLEYDEVNQLSSRAKQSSTRRRGPPHTNGSRRSRLARQR
jgi:ABC-type transport system substrate-binding protein